MKTAARWGSFAVVLVATVALVQSIFDLPFQLRASNAAFNYWAFAVLAIAAPCAVVFLCQGIENRYFRWSGVGAAGLLVIPCLVISSCAVMQAPAYYDADSSYELISETASESMTYRLYRTNCGATCAYGLALRKETELGAGLKLVSPIWSIERESDGVVSIESDYIVVKNDGVLLGKAAR